MTTATQPLVIGVAPNGARRTKADHPILPVSPGELARSAAACADAGASFIHLHVRDAEGKHVLDAEAYRSAIAAIRRARRPDELAIQVSTESGGRYERAQQMALVRELSPEAVSLALRELLPAPNAEPDAEPNTEADAAAFFAWLHEMKISAQYILYSPEEVTRFEELCARGIIPSETAWALFVLGSYEGSDAAPADLLPFLEAVKADYRWGVCAFGARESACALTAAGLGGHVRVGFENNLLNSRGERARDNAELVGQIRDGAAILGRPLARATAIPAR
jgi:3-keto-5-aminohexanoate cleavage enzyme